MYKPCSKFEGKFETQKAVFLCNDGLGHPGQFVYIRDDREEQEYFGLCEVEVFEYRSKIGQQKIWLQQAFLPPVKSPFKQDWTRSDFQTASTKYNSFHGICGYFTKYP